MTPLMDGGKYNGILPEDQWNEKAINTSNPIGEEVMVEVAMPKSFKIKMVEASKLTDFKIWSAIFSVLI